MDKSDKELIDIYKKGRPMKPNHDLKGTRPVPCCHFMVVSDSKGGTVSVKESLNSKKPSNKKTK